MSDQTPTPTYFDQAEKAISVKVSICEIPGMVSLFPANNYVGAGILLNLLKDSLASADLQPGNVGRVGPLNLCYLTFYVSNPHEASRVIVETLKQAGLDRVARIYRFDSAEGVMRCLYPDRGDAFDVSTWLEELTTAYTAYMIFQAQLQPQIEAMLENLPPNNDPGK